MADSRREKRRKARQLNVLTEAQMATGWFIILAMAALVGTIYLGQASRIANSGRRVQIMQDELDTLKRDNAVLERTIAEAQSMERLQREAAELGFARANPEEIEYLVINGYPEAQPEVQETPAVAPAPPYETMTQALWNLLQDSAGGLAQGEGSTEE